jgi:hypothetical protein
MKEFVGRRWRQMGLEDLSKTLAGLSSDDAQDLFTKTLDPALEQAEALSSRSGRRTQAIVLLGIIYPDD